MGRDGPRAVRIVVLPEPGPAGTEILDSAFSYEPREQPSIPSGLEHVRFDFADAQFEHLHENVGLLGAEARFYLPRSVGWSIWGLRE